MKKVLLSLLIALVPLSYSSVLAQVSEPQIDPEEIEIGFGTANFEFDIETNDPAGAGYAYILEKDSVGGTSWIEKGDGWIIGEGASLGYNFTNLQAGYVYHFSLQAWNSGEIGAMFSYSWVSPLQSAPEVELDGNIEVGFDEVEFEIEVDANYASTDLFVQLIHAQSGVPIFSQNIYNISDDDNVYFDIEWLTPNTTYTILAIAENYIGSDTLQIQFATLFYTDIEEPSAFLVAPYMNGSELVFQTVHETHFQLLNILGQRLETKEISPGISHIPLNHIPGGVYIWTIGDQSGKVRVN